MKTAAFLLTLVLSSSYCSGQYVEFNTFPNGLIYNSSTMKNLATIVDSLNLKFTSCELDQDYKALPQGIGHYVKIPNKTARKLIKSNVSLIEYQAKYPRSVKNKELYIVRYTYTNYEGQEMVEYTGLPGTESPRLRVPDSPSNNQLEGWVHHGNYAFYLEDLTPANIPDKYANLIQYVDCMVDTTTQIYFPLAEGVVYQSVSKGSSAELFIKWCMNYPNIPEYPDYKDEAYDSLSRVYEVEYRKWDSLRLASLDKKMETSRFRRDQLIAAKDEALETGNSDSRLEFYVARYLSKKDALSMKRSRRVVGGCSMDDSPRWHAIEICMLAAESYQWDVFLRSHLDIMNDRFDRVTDGSYAWEQRQTYIKELESLGINVTDLLLGSSFRVSNSSQNHYYGSVTRMGRALSEAEDKDKVENMIFSAISDDQLDLHNRVLIMYLMMHYNHYLTDEVRKQRNHQTLRSLKATFPTELNNIVDEMH